ncbi:MAG: citrate synthase, partial [Leptolyngbya sp. SIO3F4]|nr:citrate synthase [Leptolyngbya sp. SIO3F4]
PIFAIARVAGWLAHWKEQLAENRIFRPTQIYTGPHNQAYTNLSERLHLWDKQVQAPNSKHNGSV